jgi:hypothetical protein
MRKYASSPNFLWGPFKFIRNMIHHIFNYLSCYECDTSDNRTLLRKLYNAGYLDEGKYHQFRKRCLDDSFDPETVHKTFPFM